MQAVGLAVFFWLHGIVSFKGYAALTTSGENNNFVELVYRETSHPTFLYHLSSAK